jgi:beta-phosphoglucomutase-like phosphatase (HAD superfamily)
LTPDVAGRTLMSLPTRCVAVSATPEGAEGLLAAPFLVIAWAAELPPFGLQILDLRPARGSIG